MKIKFAFTIVMLSFAINSFSQEKEMLTKGETISYLNKVFQKVKGYKCINTGHGYGTASWNSISFIEEEGLGVTLKRITDEQILPDGCGQAGKPCWYSETRTTTFNPAYITGLELSSWDKEAPVYFANIKFVKNGLVQETSRTTGPARTYKTDDVRLYFIMADKEDFERLKKAIFHLRDLCKAEEDPFGN